MRKTFFMITKKNEKTNVHVLIYLYIKIMIQLINVKLRIKKYFIQKKF